ncbi:aminoglycoside phosphotransferase [Intrasporangium oryzae NRRL B-24470]|uniref:Aminoglycoside phosphotransferase n=1 Tax=Intrasporangium oryzae NRRL B-24470 TaxID=1386089 RepID=W9G2F4_9MICO|nr:phosphotransferase [Intrasporangium oryzae]EWT00306.1 aminoglycoside phosphotransferase [Intrasporangium oryzae NRRL B-24470]
MTRSPLVLAALASAAVPGLDPVSVEGVRVHEGDLYELAHVQDSQDRRWVVRAPRTQAAGAMLEDVASLNSLLDRRLDVAVPVVRGLAVVPEGRAAVYPHLAGLPLDFAALPPGDLAAEVGRVLAHIHNIEHVLFDEAGRPVYDAESHRRRQLSELDRAAGTGHVPTSLLTRWEQVIEDVSLWRFAPTPVHGSFTGAHVLASFDDDDASAGHVRAVLAWEESRIGDPADDFSELSALASGEALADVLEAYTQSRVEPPDPHLARRARLAAELTPVRMLLRAHASGERRLLDAAADELRRLDERLSSEAEQPPAARSSAPESGHGAAAEDCQGVPEATAASTPGSGAASGSPAAVATTFPDREEDKTPIEAASEAESEAEVAAEVPGPRRVITHHGATQLLPVGGPSGEASGDEATDEPASGRQPARPQPAGEQSAGEPDPQRPAAQQPAAEQPPAEQPAAEQPPAEPAPGGQPPGERRAGLSVAPEVTERADEDGDGLLDLHEGASDFVPVEPRQARRAAD